MSPTAVLEGEAKARTAAPAAPALDPMRDYRISHDPTQAPTDREAELYRLAEIARCRGMTIQEWYANQNIGMCEQQVEQRISAVSAWIIAHPVSV